MEGVLDGSVWKMREDEEEDPFLIGVKLDTEDKSLLAGTDALSFLIFDGFFVNSIRCFLFLVIIIVVVFIFSSSSSPSVSGMIKLNNRFCFTPGMLVLFFF